MTSHPLLSITDYTLYSECIDWQILSPGIRIQLLSRINDVDSIYCELEQNKLLDMKTNHQSLELLVIYGSITLDAYELQDGDFFQLDNQSVDRLSIKARANSKLFIRCTDIQNVLTNTTTLSNWTDPIFQWQK